MQKQMLPVSVIVPNYNSGAYLSECIRSINFGQWPAEILIIDDCSTDDSFELAMQLQKQYSNIRLLKQEKNGGAAEARRLGIAEATQDLIAFVDADDLIEVDALEEAYLIITSLGADICIWELWRFDKQHKWRHDANPAEFPITGLDAVLFTFAGWRIHPLGVARKSLYERAYQGFIETTINSDELLTRIVFSLVTKVVGCKKKYFYRSHPVSTTRTLNVRRLSSLRSQLWLLNFAHRFPAAPIEEMVHGAIWEAWFYWTRRRQIGMFATLREIRIFLYGLYRFSGLWSLLWRSPKYFFRLLFLTLAARIPL